MTKRNEALNIFLMQASKRAEKVPQDILRGTFVPIPPLMAALSSKEHHVLYGRRGTGKTHVLRYMADEQARSGNLTVYVDLTTVGLSEDLYSLSVADFGEKAARVLSEIVMSVHESLYSTVVSSNEFDDRLAAISTALDKLKDACKRIRVVADDAFAIEKGSWKSPSGSRERQADQMEVEDPPVANVRRKHSRRRQRNIAPDELIHYHLVLGELTSAVHALTASIAPSTLWLFLDEWSTVPIVLQPLVADLLRRNFFSAPGVVVKISAIERRSRFFVPLESGNYLGIELGADTSSSLDLDDFLLFRNERQHSHTFMATLLYRHLEELVRDLSDGQTPVEEAVGPIGAFVGEVFTSRRAFDMLVLASEGVPRDALQIAGLAAAAAGGGAVSAREIRIAARDFYLRDKAGRVSAHAQPVLGALINRCVEQSDRMLYLRRFGESDDPMIQELYDARLIHRVRQGVVLDDSDFATTYDVYVVDYGAFIQLLESGQIRPVRDGLDDDSSRFITDANVKIRSQSWKEVKSRWYYLR